MYRSGACADVYFRGEVRRRERLLWDGERERRGGRARWMEVMLPKRDGHSLCKWKHTHRRIRPAQSRGIPLPFTFLFFSPFFLCCRHRNQMCRKGSARRVLRVLSFVRPHSRPALPSICLGPVFVYPLMSLMNALSLSLSLCLALLITDLTLDGLLKD